MKTILICLGLFMSFPAFGSIDTIKLRSEIQEVTIFRIGAQVHRKAKVNLLRGQHVLKIEKLPLDINAQSIQVKNVRNCRILSVKHSIDQHHSRKKSKVEQALMDQNEEKEHQIGVINSTLAVLEFEENFLLDNARRSDKDLRSNISEVQAAADFYRGRINAIKKEEMALRKQIEQLKEEMAKVNKQRSKITVKKRKAFSQIIIVLDCGTPVITDLQLSYYTGTAGWTPLYDFRVESISKPLTIVYNAHVFQSSGEDWDQVQITLSTNNPKVSNIKPELQKWLLGHSRIQQRRRINYNAIGELQGNVTDRTTGETIPFASVVAEIQGRQMAGTSTDFDGFYSLKPLAAGTYNLKCSNIGMHPVLVRGVQIVPSKVTFQDIKMRSSVSDIGAVEVISFKRSLIDPQNPGSARTITREEISRMPSRSVYQADDGGALTIKGARSAGVSYYADAPIQITVSNFIKRKLNNLTYMIDHPYTILSDGKDHMIRIKEVEVPVQYVHYVVPKLEQDVFLTARITDWPLLNLISGKTSIFYQGTFTGQSFLDTKNTEDTLSISLGRDDNIVVTRDIDKTVHDRRTIGNFIKESIGLEIVVKNNKSTKAIVNVEDQIPISDRKSIDIDLLDAVGAIVDKRSGKLTWKLELEPGAKKVLSYRFSVKYPKEIDLRIE